MTELSTIEDGEKLTLIKVVQGKYSPIVQYGITRLDTTGKSTIVPIGACLHSEWLRKFKEECAA